MKIPIIECVPNFSEGRRKEVIDAIVDSVKILGIEILDIHSDRDHNRSVLTFIGIPHQVEEAILNMFEKAIELIDLNQHSGTHPRIGAIDVLPIVPIRNISIEEAVKFSRKLAKKISERFGIPIYFYEYSAKRPDRKDLPSIRNIGFEKLKEEIIYDDYRVPDIGERKLHPTAGATVIGVRDFLIAYNILIDTDDIEIAKKIAYKIREKTGYFKGIRAIGMFLAERKKCQISINIYQPEIVDLDILLYNIEKLSKIYGTRVLESEVVGLVPYENIERVFKNTLKISYNTKDLAIEKRIFDNVDELKLLISAIGSKMANMGGGLAGGISLALGISLWRKAMLVSKDINYDIKKIDQYIEKALYLAKKDSEAFERLLKEKSLDALKSCIDVSMDFANVCINVLRDIETIIENINENIISDLGIALELIRSALNSSKYNILINLKHSENEEYNISVLNSFRQIEERFIFLYEALTSKISLRLY